MENYNQPKKKSLLKKVLLYGLLPLVVVFWISIIGAIFLNDESEIDESEEVAAQTDTEDSNRITDSIYQVRFMEGVAKAETLMDRFNETHDEFESYSYYVHKNWIAEGTANHTTPVVLIGENGQMLMRTVYLGEDWVFHESAIFIIDGKKYETPHVPKYDVNNYSEVIHGGVYERVTYGTSIDHYPAYMAMSDNPIKVRLQGSQKNYDFEIREKDHQAIKDSYELSKALKAIARYVE